MGADVYLNERFVSPSSGAERCIEIKHLYCTYNLSKMFYTACEAVGSPIVKGESFHSTWVKLPTNQIKPFLLPVLKELQCKPEVYKPMEPANGWGSYDSGIRFLAEVIQLSQLNPGAEWKAWL
jgi:hypothetical protein